MTRTYIKGGCRCEQRLLYRGIKRATRGEWHSLAGHVQGKYCVAGDPGQIGVGQPVCGYGSFIKEGEAKTVGTGSREGTESGNGTQALKS